MKKQIIQIIVAILVTALSSAFIRYLINIIANAEISVLSIGNILICAALPVIMIFFDKRHSAVRIAIIAFAYTILYNIVDYWWI